MLGFVCKYIKNYSKLCKIGIVCNKIRAVLYRRNMGETGLTASAKSSLTEKKYEQLYYTIIYRLRQRGKQKNTQQGAKRSGELKLAQLPAPFASHHAVESQQDKGDAEQLAHVEEHGCLEVDLILLGELDEYARKEYKEYT